MLEPIINIKNISKKYNITHQQGGYVALRDVLTNVAKKPFAFLKHKAKAAIGKAGKEEFWALKNINFEVQKGEAIGIIGANGAGKSTLLKILTGITPPTTGEITMQGKIASLLEVGTGFHPELTGRENIFLNGAIMGMTKKEISDKFNNIVEFAGVKKFIDTPVKRYSSGMLVRLGFSVAAHMEPDILLVDEVLAVGDAEFQKKCLGKMDEVTKTAGRTILFVSHNLTAIQNLCGRCILLKDGRIEIIGGAKDVIEKYLSKEVKSPIISLESRKDRTGKGGIKFIDIKITNGKKSKIIKSGDKLKITLKYSSDFKEKIARARVVITITDETLQTVLRLDSEVTSQTFKDDLNSQGVIICETGETHLIEGRYLANIDFLVKGASRDYIIAASAFNVKTNNEEYNYRINPDKSVCNYLIKYNFKQ